MLQRFLQHAGYNLLTATYADQAIKMAANHPGGIHLLIANVLLPDMNGQQLADYLSVLYPRIKTILISSYSQYSLVSEGIVDPETPFLEKPFSLTLLLQMVQDRLGAA
jgi:DNA-binding NtrC family response regulator